MINLDNRFISTFNPFPIREAYQNPGGVYSHELLFQWHKALFK